MSEQFQKGELGRIYWPAANDPILWFKYKECAAGAVRYIKGKNINLLWYKWPWMLTITFQQSKFQVWSLVSQSSFWDVWITVKYCFFLEWGEEVLLAIPDNFGTWCPENRSSCLKTIAKSNISFQTKKHVKPVCYQSVTCIRWINDCSSDASDIKVRLLGIFFCETSRFAGLALQIAKDRKLRNIVLAFISKSWSTPA